MDKDIAYNLYFMNPQRFADLINGYACHGKQVILPQNLQDMDPRSGMYRMENIRAEDDVNYINPKWEKKTPRIRYRDLKKQATTGMNFLIIGLENQETIDYSLPVRIMSGDVGEYEQQIFVWYLILFAIPMIRLN